MIALLLWAQISSANADQVQKTAELQGAKSAILCLAFSPDGKTLASGEVDRKIRLWDAASGRPLATLEGHTKQVAALAFSPDGGTLHSAGYDATVRLWDVATGKSRDVQAGDPKNGVLGPSVDDLRATFSPDASLLAYGAYLYAWDLKAKKNLPSQQSLVVRGWFDFEPGGATILSVCGSPKETDQIRNFERWDVRANKVVAGWDGTAGAAYERLAVSRDGAWAATVNAGDDNLWKIEIWSVGEKKRTLAPGAHAGTVNGMAFTKDGSAVATASLDRSVRIWDVKSGKELAVLRHAQGFMGLAFSADGSRMATADITGAVQLWGPK